MFVVAWAEVAALIAAVDKIVAADAETVVAAAIVAVVAEIVEAFDLLL